MAGMPKGADDFDRLFNGLFDDLFAKPRDVVAFPEWILRQYLPELKARGIIPRKVEAFVSGMRFPLLVVPVRGERFPKGEPVTIERLTERKREAFLALLEMVYGCVDERRLRTRTALVMNERDPDIVPVVAPSMGCVSVFDGVDVPGKDEENDARKDARDAYRRVLTEFSALSGLTVNFRADMIGIREPFPSIGRIIDLIDSAVPTGEVQDVRYVGKAFGVWIAGPSTEVATLAPTPGRGIVAVDDRKQPVLQLVGNSWYALVPMMKNFNGETSVSIMKAILDAGFRAWSAEREKASSARGRKRSVGRRKFVGFASLWVGSVPLMARIEEKDLVDRIGEKQRELLALERQLLLLRATAQGFVRSDVYLSAKPRLSKDYRRIQRMPEVALLTLDESGIQVESRTLYHEHEGQRYELGEFAVRVSLTGAVSVWCLRPAHPDGEPHPHYPKHGTPCFGNAVEAIRKAGVEMRVADAFDYVFRWLTEGYCPQTTVRSIAEWPVVPPPRPLGPGMMHDHIGPDGKSLPPPAPPSDEAGTQDGSQEGEGS